MTVFDKIINREIEADILYEDDRAIAFRDIAPVAPVHVLVIPKQPIVNLALADDAHRDLLGHLLLVARDVARQQGLAEGGYRLVANTGSNGGQSVAHLHFHIIGGAPLGWPPFPPD